MLPRRAREDREAAERVGGRAPGHREGRGEGRQGRGVLAPDRRVAEEGEQAVGALEGARVEASFPAGRGRGERGDRRPDVPRGEEARQLGDGGLPGRVGRVAAPPGGKQRWEGVVARQEAARARDAVVLGPRRYPEVQRRGRRAPGRRPGLVARGHGLVVVAVGRDAGDGALGGVGLDERRRDVDVPFRRDEDRRRFERRGQRRRVVVLGHVLGRAPEVAGHGVALVAQPRLEAGDHVGDGRDGDAEGRDARVAFAGVDREARAGAVAHDDDPVAVDVGVVRDDPERRRDVLLGRREGRAAIAVLDEGDGEATVEEEGHQRRRLRVASFPLGLPEAPVDQDDGGRGPRRCLVEVDDLVGVGAVAEPARRRDAAEQFPDARRLAPHRRVRLAAVVGGFRRRGSSFPAKEGVGDAERAPRLEEGRVVALALARRAVVEVGVSRDRVAVSVQFEDRFQEPSPLHFLGAREGLAGGVEDAAAAAVALDGRAVAVARVRGALQIRVDDVDVVLERARRHDAEGRRVVDGARPEGRRHEQDLGALDGQGPRGLGEFDVEAWAGKG